MPSAPKRSRSKKNHFQTTFLNESTKIDILIENGNLSNFRLIYILDKIYIFEKKFQVVQFFKYYLVILPGHRVNVRHTFVSQLETIGAGSDTSQDLVLGKGHTFLPN